MTYVFRCMEIFCKECHVNTTICPHCECGTLSNPYHVHEKGGTRTLSREEIGLRVYKDSLKEKLV